MPLRLHGHPGDVSPVDRPHGRIAMLSLHTSPLAPLGGRETGGMNVYVREVARRLARSGFAVDVFTRRTDPQTPEVQPLGDGARLVHIPAGPAQPIAKEQLLGHVPAFVAGVRRYWERRPYDLCYSHYWLSAEAGRRLTADTTAPHVAMFHTLAAIKQHAGATGGPGQPTDPPVRLATEAELVHAVDRVVAATEHERDLLGELFGLAPERVAVIPPGVDTERFRPGVARSAGGRAAGDRLEDDRAGARRALGLPVDQPLILSVGRMEELKGFDLLIDALASMEYRSEARAESADAPPPRLALLGGDADGDERGRLLELAEAAGVAPRVLLPGAVPHDELRRWYIAADLVAMPSRYESFGLVAVEAMACGTPVVASRVGGLAATVLHEETGLLVDWRCGTAFAGAFDRLLHDPARLHDMGLAARRRALTFGWDGVAERLVALIDGLLAPPGAESRSDAGAGLPLGRSA